MKKVYTICCALALKATTLLAQSPLPIYEPFALNLGTLGGQNTWTGPTGADQGAQVVDSNLTYTGLATSSSYAVRVGNQNAGAIQQLVFLPQNTKTYTAFLIRLSALPPTLIAGSYYVTMGNGQTPGATMYAIPNADGTTFELGFNTLAAIPATNNRTNQSFQLGATIMVVMAYTPATAASNGTGALSVWVNPSSADIAPGATEPTPTFTNITGGNLANVANVFIRSGTNTRPMIFDELRIGKTWSEVTTTSATLPVAITDFMLTNKSNNSLLSWTSKSETNFSKYIVMFSNNGTDFKEVGAVAPKGSNASYTFAYQHQVDGYFKLKMMDLDGSYTYSKVIHAKVKSVNIKVGPNPVAEQLLITAMPEGKNTIVLYNLNGAALKTQTVNSSNCTMLLPVLPTGQYIVKVIHDGKPIFSTTITK
jgi:hypothetical protein